VTTHLPPVTVSQLLEHEFLAPLGMDAAEFAAAIDVPLAVLEQLLQGRRRVDADLDRRLCACFGLSAGYWLRAQELADLEGLAFVNNKPLL
jgi:addiction module HigA family antidote